MIISSFGTLGQFGKLLSHFPKVLYLTNINARNDTEKISMAPALRMTRFTKRGYNFF